MFDNPLFNCIKKASEILKTSQENLTKILNDIGIEDNDVGVNIIKYTSAAELSVALNARCDLKLSPLLINAAASCLKDESNMEPEKALPITIGDPSIYAVTEMLKMSRPIQQWSDKELLEQYIKDKSYEVEAELIKRSRGQHFIVLLPGKNRQDKPGEENIDIEKSLNLLKSSRRRTNPTIIPNGEFFSPVYRIAELNPNDRIIELCPFCGESLYEGYCDQCQTNFSGIGDEERVFIYMVGKSKWIDLKCSSDRKALITSAYKGLEDLYKTWPGIVKDFEDAQIENSLPKFRVIKKFPTKADPFYLDNSVHGSNK